MTGRALAGTRWLRLMWVVMLTCVTFVVGCSEKPEADLVFISGAAHNTLDPQKMSWMHDGRIAKQLYEGLVQVDFVTHEIEPAAAESWTVSDNGRVYTFVLRDDAKWSNGDTVTSQDFANAWMRALLPDSASDYSRKLFVIRGAKTFYEWRSKQLTSFTVIRKRAGGEADNSTQDAADNVWKLTQNEFARTVGIRTPDERTLVVELSRPTPYFLSMLSLSVFLPVHSASLETYSWNEAETGMRQTETVYFGDPKVLVTNGPYRLADRAHQEWLLMEANEHYWNAAAVGPKSVLQRIIKDPLAAEKAYSNGEADWVVDVPSAHRIAQQLLDSGRDDVHVSPLAGTYFYNFNCMPEVNGKPNPLADVRVRRAFAMAIDRQAIVNDITKAGQTVAKSFVPPNAIEGYIPPVDEAVLFDPEQARALLAEAGYPDGKGLEHLSILLNTGAGHETIAQFIANQWKEHLGVSLAIEAIDVTGFAERLDNQQYTIARAAWIGDYPDPSTFLNKVASDSENNDCKWVNQQYDAYLAQAASADSLEQRMTYLAQAEAVLQQDQPMALIFHYVNIDLARPPLDVIERNHWGRWRMWEFPTGGN